MRLKKRYLTSAVTAGAALVLMAAPAQAATGELILRGPGPDTVITDPGAGCIASASGFSEIVNDTDTYVTVHTGHSCTGFGLVVSPGHTVQVGDRHSVRVPR